MLRIAEVEAYGGPEDSASHARFGRTDRNAPMWGPGGRAYVYLCYGIHDMLNVSADGPGQASAILIRGAEPLAGHDTIVERRGGRVGPSSLAGPGKVGAALAVDPTWSGHRLDRAGGLSVLPSRGPVALASGRRVGIDFAAPTDRRRLWRFALAGSPWVSHRAGLRPE